MAVWAPQAPLRSAGAPQPTGFLLPGLAATAGLAVLVASALGDGSVNQLAVAVRDLHAGRRWVRLAGSVRSLRMLTQRHEQHS